MAPPWVGITDHTCMSGGFLTATCLQVYRGRDKSPVKESLTDVSGREDVLSPLAADA